MNNGKPYEEIQIGEKASFSKTISESDVYLFAGISGDLNPAHINEEYSQNTYFKKRIAHGLIAASLISTVLGTKLPGPGTIWISQDIKFLAPVYFNDTITATVEVIEKIEDKKWIKFKSWCKNQDGKMVLEGECVVSPKRQKLNGIKKF